jgi:thiosulfate reductase cytochrome b subunit
MALSATTTDSTTGRVSSRMAHRTTQPPAAAHASWVRSTHWIGAVSFLLLAVSGVIILMAHPRLYWGEVGNDLTPALLELPISRNHQHGGWEGRIPFSDVAGAPDSASRTYEIFNQNAWGRSLHFLAAWMIVVTGAVYLVAGMITGHFRRHLVPPAAELTLSLLGQDLRDHLRLRIRPATSGPHYSLLQKCAYAAVVFFALPVMALTGLAMSPAVTATYPFLSGMFGGFQSARTIHFVIFVALVLFLFGHVLLVVLSGFTRHMRAMTVGD